MADRLFFFMFGGIFASIGSIFLAVGWGFIQDTRTFLATAASSPGEVIALKRSESNQNGEQSSSTYYPVVKFVGPEGEPVRFEGQVGSNPPAFRVGQPVTVLYNPQQPQNARIRSFGELWLGGTIFMGMGGLFVLIGGVAVGSQWRTRRRTHPGS